MHITKKQAALAAALVLSSAAHAAAPAPEAGRWITASGNLEVEIGPCGDVWCGTVTRVLASQSMSQPNMPMKDTASPLGRRILLGLRPLDGGGWEGSIANRETGKTYRSRLALQTPDRLELTIYDQHPGDGQIQVWRRATPADGVGAAQ